MKFLLINPASDLRKIPNLGLGYLSSALKSNGFEVRVLDRHQIGSNGRNFIETISSGAWDVAGFQTYSAMVPETLRLAEIIKKTRKKTIVVAGGTHPSALPEDLLFDGSPVDYVFVGEAEKALIEFAKAAGDRKRLEGIRGLTFRNGNGEIRATKPDYIANLDDIPFPDWDQISPLKYPVSPIGAFYRALPSAPILTSRGCPFGCKYCASHSVVGSLVRVRSSLNIAEEIDILERKFGVKELQILDDNFTLKREHALSVCAMLAGRKRKLFINLPNGIHVSTLDAELVKLLREAGVYSLTVGIDSGSQEVLKRMNRATPLDMVEEKVRLIRELTDIKITGNFIIGLPGEKEEDLKKTIDFANRLPLHRVNYHFFIPLPGSAIFDELKNSGRLDKLNYTKMVPERLSYIPDGLTRRILIKAKLTGIVSFYLRYGIFKDIFGEIKGFSHFMFLAKKLFHQISGG